MIEDVYFYLKANDVGNFFATINVHIKVKSRLTVNRN